VRFNRTVNVANIIAACAVLAAAVTALWVYRWPRRGKLNLEILVASTSGLVVRATNENDYEVKIEQIGIMMRSPEGSDSGGLHPPEQLDVPSNVPAHDSVSWEWTADELRSKVAFLPGSVVAVTATTNLGRMFHANGKVTGL
jgi:hypothetical protein